MNPNLKSRPKWFGAAAVAIAIASAAMAQFDNDPATSPNWNQVLTAILGLGLLTSRDNKQSSETVKAK